MLFRSKRIAIKDFMKKEGMNDAEYSPFIEGVVYSPTSTLNDSIKAEIRFRYFVDKYYRKEYSAHMRQFKKDNHGDGVGSTAYGWQKMKENLATVDFTRAYGEIPKPEGKLSTLKTSIF